MLAASVHLFGFRTPGLLERIAWTVGLSFAVSPIVGILLGRMVSLGPVAILFEAICGRWLAAASVGLSLAAESRPEESVRSRRSGTAVGILLVIPYLRDLLGFHSGNAGGASAGVGHLFQFGVRKMIDSGLITTLPAFAGVHLRHPVLLDQSVRLLLPILRLLLPILRLLLPILRLLLPIPGYALELGFYALVLMITIRARKSLKPIYATALCLSIGGLLLVGFLRSAVIGNNDFGYRTALIACFFLLLLAADRMTSTCSKGWLTPARCCNTQTIGSKLFATPAPPGAAARKFCQNLGIGYLAVTDSDLAWCRYKWVGLDTSSCDQ